MRKFTMTSVGGSTQKPSRRKLDRLARARGYRNAKAWAQAIISAQFQRQLGTITGRLSAPEPAGYQELPKEAA
ncbi:hypothetical protein [Paraburkholderia youngii]|uniref:Uncharacterized protein n=1 Tax=Paraburkholderia youngii TaxID=2782701 RepID=A0A7Y6MXT7_9BURK|nr:hypothetical protein [Paraburkholderia youngii]NUX98759.1 hypothetical protein [Paraburkholderia youngii]